MNGPSWQREFTLTEHAGTNAGRHPHQGADIAGVPCRGVFPLATVLVKDLIEAGVHFGHRASRWNPKMRPYIYGRRNLIHIIDVRETIRGLLRARKYLQGVAASGGLVLFVGTKRQASDTIEHQGLACGMPFVSDRWLGGTLTNFRTIRSRLTPLGRARSPAQPATSWPPIRRRCSRR